MQQQGEGLSGEAEEGRRDQFSCGTGGPLGLEVRAEGKVHNGVLCTYVHACSYVTHAVWSC